jgi:hypothetical protein
VNAEINIECDPTPDMYAEFSLSTSQVVLADETGDVLTDEAGNIIASDD